MASRLPRTHTLEAESQTYSRPDSKRVHGSPLTALRIDKENAYLLRRPETTTSTLTLHLLSCTRSHVLVGWCIAIEQQEFLAVPRLSQRRVAHTTSAPSTLHHLKGFPSRGPNPLLQAGPFPFSCISPQNIGLSVI